MRKHRTPGEKLNRVQQTAPPQTIQTATAIHMMVILKAGSNPAQPQGCIMKTV